jgi:hypothetical protein
MSPPLAAEVLWRVKGRFALDEYAEDRCRGAGFH